MEKIEFQVPEGISKERLDKLVTAELFDYSRSRIQNIIKSGDVKVNGQKVDGISFKVSSGDNIEVIIAEPQAVEIKPAPEIKLDIVFEDEDLMVINKQAGLTVHPGAGNYHDTLVNALIAYVDDLSGINGELRPGIVHRLDRDTSGLMLVAKNDNAHNSLAEQIQTREVTRIYHALVWNCPDLPRGKIKTKIGRSQKDRTKMSVVKSSGKDAITHYKLIKSYYNKAISLLECQLETGRTHQIRVHMEHKKMPLVGDKSYAGQPTYKRPNRIHEDIRPLVQNFPRQALHSKYIRFFHPTYDKEMEFEIDYPDDIKALLNSII
jgi:23S rRNA pseudouridine1911/1915/1917 synthase